MNKLFTFTILLLSQSIFGQQLDTTKLFDLEKLSNRTVNSSYHEGAPMITPDGNTLYFFVTNHPQNKAGKNGSQDVWFSVKNAKGEWSKAERMNSTINREKSNQVMAVVNDGNTLILDNSTAKKKALAYSDLKNGEWSKPKTLDVKDYTKMSKGDFSGANMTNDMKVVLLYFNEKAGSKKSDLYVSFQIGDHSYSKPVKLDINSSHDDFGPFICADNETMYFASDRPGGFGQADIYVTHRLDDTWLHWSKPKNIGEPVNTKGFDAYFSMDQSMENAYTTRAYMSRDGGSLDILALTTCPEIKIQGTVLDYYTQKPIQGFVDVNVEGVGNITLECDKNGFYTATLKDKGRYLFNVHAEKYEPTLDTVNFSTAKKEILTKNFFLKPIFPKVFLSGNVYDSKTDKHLEASLQFKTQHFDAQNVKSTAKHGYYQLTLPNTGKYVVSIQKNGYYEYTEEITFGDKDNTDDQHLSHDFKLTPIAKKIVVAGLLLNEKDQSPVKGTLTFTSLSGKHVKATANANGEYNITLPDPGHYQITSINEGFLTYIGEIDVEIPETNTPTEKDLLLTPIEIGATVRLNEIYFDFDKATLRPESFPELERVVEFMQNNPSLEIEISGHTDDKGSEAYNLNLSQNRANSVKNYVVSKQIAASRIQAKGYGKSQPEVPNDSDENRQINRRVQFTILKK